MSENVITSPSGAIGWGASITQLIKNIMNILIANILVLIANICILAIVIKLYTEYFKDKSADQRPKKEG